jgi:biopolymer transport protein ExbD
MSRRRRISDDTEKDIDISPLIDVVFILLIFFMVSTTFVKDAKLDLERPSAQSAVPASAESVRVSIDRNGTVYAGEVPVRPWMLQSRVREMLRGGAQDTVLVVSDRRVPAESLIEVVDQCRLAGAKNVGVVIDSEASAFAAEG